MMLSDSELVAMVCEHNTDAFEELSTRYREIIYRHVFSTVRDSDATEDVVQEVFLRIWIHAEQWNGRDYGAFMGHHPSCSSIYATDISCVSSRAQY